MKRSAACRRPAADAAPAATGVEQNLGEIVRRLWTARELSVRTLASRAGFSPSFISQVEHNQASPSIASLQRLADALGVSRGDFFRDRGGDARPVTRATMRPRLTIWWSRARIEALSPMGAGRGFEAVMITLGAGGSSGKRPHAHAGQALAIVFDGAVRLTLGAEVLRLVAGDTVSLDPGTLHLWENPARKPVRLVLVSTRFASDLRAGPS
jgi:transcriptional regulator with XRE-family HTH domain